MSELIKPGDTLPRRVSPMLPAEFDLLHVEPETRIWEIKHNGWRVMARIDGGGTVLKPKTMPNITVPEIQQELTGLPNGTILDGELVAISGGQEVPTLVDSRGVPKIFYAFDLIYLSGASTMNYPIELRKRLLARIVEPLSHVRYVEHSENGLSVLEQVIREGMEGVVMKRTEGKYRPGYKGYEWMKFKLEQTTKDPQLFRRFSDVLAGTYTRR